MIIFYNKKTKDIFGRVDGRIHDNPKSELVKPSNINKKDVGRYVVPFKTVFREDKIPIKKWFMVNKKTKEVEEKVVGYTKRTVPNGMIPDVSFASIILDFEAGIKNIYDYRVRLDKDEKVIGFIKKKK